MTDSYNPVYNREEEAQHINRLEEIQDKENEVRKLKQEKDDDGIKTVSELFGETDSDPADTSNTASDIFTDNPLTGLLTAFSSDLGIQEKNAYAVRKLLEKPEVQSKLNNANDHQRKD